MSNYQGMISFKHSNERKTILLLTLFPLFLFGITWLIMLFFGTNTAYEMNQRINEALYNTAGVFMLLGPIIIIRAVVVFFFQKQLMFSFSGARELTRKENPEIYNIIENLCISRGLQTPRIGIIDTSGFNAFATGWRAKDSWIIFTSGLVQTLDKREIEAVAAHELSHIINKDSLLMLVTVVYIGIISMMGSILIRTSSRGSDNKNNLLPLVGLGFLVLGYLIYPLIRLAVSRKREFLADLGAVELTKDNEAMISALEKISGHSAVPSANTNISMFFINSPDDLPHMNALEKKRAKSSLRDTHPTISERVEALRNY
ncbi:MAG: M48 family metallopeptidase [Candidatus Absconditabacteria bacterium]|nr:M48 family metallopeptidase [Candidatus Absconditabacteria bacterium]MDD3868473.1 M48 family metallopeptidase [Candidatus Absconditabacteria bacterium]MDD4713953.1 M48 family metallopeptidase [Candidatus Absconditabacteria bacterium]